MPSSPTRLAAVRPSPVLAAPRTGLLAAASVSDSLGNVRWGKGVAWLSELHQTDSEAFGARPIDCSDSDAIALGADDKAPTGGADPFLVYAFDWCSAMEGLDQRDWQGRARRLLEATQSRSIAKEFWSGAISSARTLSNTWLAKTGSSIVTSAATAPGKALALLDHYVVDALSNGTGMIHCTAKTLDRMVQDQALVKEGGLWRTPNGNIVVADAGYSGDKDGVDAAQEWMFASTVPEIVLGPARTSRSDSPIGGEMVSVSVNDVLVYTERDVIVMHEPDLCWGAAQIDLS